MSKKKDLTSKIERLEAFEDRLSVEFKNLSAFLDDSDEDYMSIDVHGELHAANGSELRDNVEVVIAAYDSSDRVVGTDTTYFDNESFFGLETFSSSINISVKNISKVRIYPKKG